MSLSKCHDPLKSMPHPQFEPEIKRAILASWSSDAQSAEDLVDCLRSLRGGSSGRLCHSGPETRAPGKPEA
jgi:hypothetical protein